jgi:outer membrane protein insertion porin family
MRIRFSILNLVLFFLAVAPVLQPGLFLRGAEAATVSRVVINGNARVENETVLSYMQLGAGDQIDAEAIDESIKTLFQTGLFRDVSIDVQGGTLVVTVLENPLINVVNFEGNDEIDDETLAKEVEVRERMIFTKARVSGDTRRILALYQKQGYYNVSVVPKQIRLAENRINLVFEINEGVKTRVSEVNFEGNTYFSDGRLRDVISTKQYSWFRYFGSSANYDENKVEYDKEQLRRHYLKHGFIDAQILGADVQLAPNGDSFIVTFSVSEGTQYSIADVAINVGESNLEPKPLQRVVKTGVGDRFDGTKVDRSVERITLEAAKQGFVFAKVDPRVDRNADGNTINLTYDIVEGPRTYVERIDIVGNTRTHDEVIRREIKIFEGDAYNKALIERARRKLVGLDFFERVEIKEEEGSAADKVVLVFEVAEKSTGSLSFSLGYSSIETVVGSVGLSERNLFGRGWNAKLNTKLSFKNQQLDFSFTEPYFMGLPISVGTDLYAKRNDNQDASSYKSDQIGGALRVGFQLDEFSNVFFKYQLERRRISDIDVATSSPAIIAQGGKSWKSALSATYTYSDLDNPQKPTTGWQAQLESEIAGLGGDTEFGKFEASAYYFYPLYEEQVVLKFEGNIGHIQSFGNDVPLSDRFFKGGDQFRGFASSGIGPMMTGNDGVNDSIGAQTYAIGTVEMTFPLYGIPEGWGLEGAVFSDFGTVFNAVENTVLNGGPNCAGSVGYNGPCSVFDKNALRASIGAGVIWQSPFGPLRLNASYPILKESTDKTEWLQFSIGTRF